MQLDFVQKLNRGTAGPMGESSRIEGLISSYELAFRMQSEMPKVMDLSKETAATQKLYGIEEERGGAEAGPVARRAAPVALAGSASWPVAWPRRASASSR